MNSNLPTLNNSRDLLCYRMYENIERLREDLYKLVSWSKEWQMLFNIEKCKVMHLGYDNPHASYFVDGNRLQVVSEERDLGVIMS